MYAEYYGCKTQNWMVTSQIPFVGGDQTANGKRSPFLVGPAGTNLGTKNVLLHTSYGTFRQRTCWHPRPHASYAVAFFFSFAMLAGFVLTSLFIGAVTGGMAGALVILRRPFLCYLREIKAFNLIGRV